MQRNLKEFYENNPKIFRRRLWKGPPPEYRWAAWKVISGALQYEVSGAYEESLRKADQYEENEHKVLNQINLDLNRTYPWHPFFNSEKYGVIGQNVLKKALRSYAMYNSEVGYTQSINFVMGFFLIVNDGRDEEAFWQFVAISNRNHSYGKVENFDGGFGEFYCDNFPLYRQFVYQFEWLFAEILPQLKSHFDQLGFYSDIYLQNWFMTLFNCFPMDLCIRLWDHLLVEGLPYMFKFPLAIMQILEKDLLAHDLEGVNDIIMSVRKPYDGPLPSVEEVISKTNKIDVTKADLQRLKKEYESNIAKNPPKEIKRLQTLFYDINEDVNSLWEPNADARHDFNIEAEKDVESTVSKIYLSNSYYLRSMIFLIFTYQNLR